MFGYVTASWKELTKQEQERYGAVYCGICRRIRLQSGNTARLALSYDMAFLALLLILQSLLFTLMFMTLPNKRNRFLDSLPGGVLSSLGWLVYSDLYSIYVEHFSNYANIYGSVYAIALCMLWLYCCMSILFYGGALNRYLMEKE